MGDAVVFIAHSISRARDQKVPRCQLNVPRVAQTVILWGARHVAHGVERSTRAASS